MKITYDLHTHSTYSHGKGSILENAKSAQEKGLKGIAITDHGFSHPAFGMKRGKIEQMKLDCKNAELETGVRVMLGIESNICGQSGKTDVKPQDYQNLEVFAAGIHRFIYYDTFYDYMRLLGDTVFFTLFKKNPSKSIVNYTTKVYINTIKNNPVDFIAHLNFLVFCDCRAVAECCADYGTHIEINTKKVHLSDGQWEDILKTKVKFVVNSDAHTCDRIGDTQIFGELNGRVKTPKNRIVNISDEFPKLRFSEYKKKL